MGYVKTKNKAMPLLRRVYKDYPQLLDTLPGGRTCTTRPPPPSGRRSAGGRSLSSARRPPWTSHRVEHDRARIQAVYDLGRAVMEKRLEAMKAFLQEERP